MEKTEREFIKSSIYKLVKDTKCHDQFLSYFVSKRILSDSDIEYINKEGTDSARTKRFYDLIVQRKHSFKYLLKGLTKTCQTGARDILDEYAKGVVAATGSGTTATTNLPDSNPTVSFKYNVRAPAPLFTGRSSELEELHSKLTKPVTDKNVFNIVAVCGLGGIGKTELVRKYIQEKFTIYYDHVIWINAEVDIIKESFRNLAKDKLNITTRDADQGEKGIKSVVNEIYQKFLETKSLFVFDNAERDPYLSDFLPQDYIKCTHGSFLNIIITSRIIEWSADVEVQKIRKLGQGDAVEFVRKGLEITSQEEIDEITELVDALQCIPLALQQAIAYIKEEKQNYMGEDDYSIKSFLGEYRNKKHFYTHPPKILLHDNYNETLFTTWKMTLDKIDSHEDMGSLANNIINCMAYMSSNFDRSIFFPLSKNVREIGKAIRLLLKYSMINGDLKQSSKLRIHRLVQEVIRMHHQNENLEEEVVELTLKLLDQKDKKDGNLDHAISVWSFAKKYTNLVKSYCRFPSAIVEGLIFRDRFREALEFGKENVQLLVLDLKFDSNHPDVLELWHQIGVAHFRLGNYKEGMEILEKVLQGRKQAFGEKNPETLNTIHFIASLKLKKGEYEEARNMFQDVFKKKCEELGTNNEKTIDSLFNEGICLLEMSEYTEALKVYEKACGMYMKASGPDSDAVVDSLQNIAVLNGDMGRVGLAVQSLKDLRKRPSLQKYSIRKLTIDQNLAFYLLRLGNYKEAFELCQETLEKLTQANGNDYLDSLITKSNFGIIYRKMKKYDEALSIQKEVYKLVKARFGKDNDKTLLVRAEIAIVEGMQNVFEKSRSTLKEIIGIMEGRRGYRNHNVLWLRLELADVLEQNGQYGEALVMLEISKKTIEDLKIDDHIELPSIIDRMTKLKEMVK